MPSSWCQEASVAAVMLSERSGVGVSLPPGSTGGGLCWVYGSVELVELHKDMAAQGRIKANGLQLPAFL